MVEEPQNEPHYEHDCSECVYLGDAEFGGQLFDLYFCTQRPPLVTVIARRSSDPHDYTSGIALAAVDPVLAEALARAEARGLVTVENGTAVSHS